MQWKWLNVIILPLLFSGCAAMKLVADQLDPFAKRPPCPIPGTRPDVAPDAPCYYKLEITSSEKLTSEGVVNGKIPLTVVEDMKKHRDGDSEPQKALRDSFKTANYPRPEYLNIPVKNPNDLTNDLPRLNNKVAVFVLETGEDRYTYLYDVCSRKESDIRKHMETYKEQYEREHLKKYDSQYEIPPKYIDECPNLANLKGIKKQTP